MVLSSLQSNLCSRVFSQRRSKPNKSSLARSFSLSIFLSFSPFFRLSLSLSIDRHRVGSICIYSAAASASYCYFSQLYKFLVFFRVKYPFIYLSMEEEQGSHVPPLSSDKSSLQGLDIAHAFFKPLLQSAPPSPTKRHTKVSVIGAGNVGMAIAQTILTQDLTDELALVDAKPEKLRGEMLDLQHAAAFLPRTRILASVDYSVTAGSDLCIVTAGARQIPGESRLNLVQRNVALFSDIVPRLASHSPDSILLIVSNPVDVLTYVAWKLSGFPSNRVIGSGTNLDSSRFRSLIADHLDVNAQDVQAYIVGEHGDSSVALWSSISVGGVPVLSFLEKKEIAYEKEALERIHRAVIGSAYEVIRLKGYTSWAIGYSVASLARSLLRDQRRIHPVSVLAKGFYGMDAGEVFLSLPAQLGRGGVLAVTHVHLTEEEAERLRDSANTILEVQNQLHLHLGGGGGGGGGGV